MQKLDIDSLFDTLEKRSADRNPYRNKTAEEVSAIRAKIKAAKAAFKDAPGTCIRCGESLLRPKVTETRWAEAHGYCSDKCEREDEPK